MRRSSPGAPSRVPSGHSRVAHARGDEPWQRVAKVGAREAFFRTDGPAAGPLLVVHHVRKTAGTSLRGFVRTNLALLPVQAEALPPGASKRGDEPAESRAWYREWYRGLDDDRRGRLCCVMGHTAGYLLPSLDRPFEALLLVRDPLARVLSYHFDHKHRRPRADVEPVAALARVYDEAEGRPPERAKVWEYFNGQSRHLLSVFDEPRALPVTAGPPPDAERWRERMRALVGDVFLAGVQERFADYVDELAARHGWRPFVPRGKANPRRPPADALPARLRETIVAYNWLDAELHELARAAQERRAAARP